MSRLFLATSFSGHVNYETGEVHSDHREKVQGAIQSLRDIGGFDVFCAVEHEGWKVKTDIPAEVGVELDLEQIRKSDLVLALLPKGSSSEGLQYEIGYASAIGKLVIVATEPESNLGYFNSGAVNAGLVRRVVTESPESLAEQVRLIHLGR